MLKNSNSPVETAWLRYHAIWQRQIANPELLDDPAHIVALQIAHARFMVAFKGSNDE